MESSDGSTRLRCTSLWRRCSLLPVIAVAVASQSFSQETRHLPDWVTLSGEIRGRAEVYAGSNRIPGRTEWYYLNRIRFNTTLRPLSKLHVFIQMQDSRAPRTEGLPAPANLVDTADLRQAYLHLGAPEDKGWFVRAGRQPLSFGGARLLWMSEWGNVGPGFDGIRIGFGSEHYALNWFGASAVQPVVEDFDRPRSDRQIYGFFGTFRKIVPRGVLEPFSIWKHNRAATCEHGRPGHLDVLTTGFRASGRPHARFDWVSDFAVQRGHIASDHASAWAGHWEAGYRPFNDSTGPRLLAEYQRASGDQQTGDGTHGSFDQLYPAWKFGTADPIGWSNMQEGAAGVEWTLARSWAFRAAYHHFWLLHRNDSLYAANGAALGRNPQARSRRIGGEADIRVTHRFSRHFQLMAGFGRFMAGPYWKQTRNNSGITYPFVMWTWSF